MLKAVFLSFLILTSLNSYADTTIESIPTKGNLSSVVNVTMFGDYQCPYTQEGNATINQLLSEGPNNFAFSFRHFPLSFHEHARYASKSAICSSEQGKFWKMNDLIFSLDYDDFNPANIKKFVKKLGLDEVAFEKCMVSDVADKIIERDIKEGQSLKITGTPTFIITGPKGTSVLIGAYPKEDILKSIFEAQ